MSSPLLLLLLQDSNYTPPAGDVLLDENSGPLYEDDGVTPLTEG